MAEHIQLNDSGRAIAEERARLAFDASFEISSLAAILRRLIDEANLDGVGKACRGMLIRIEQLGEAVGACVDEDPVASYGMDERMLRKTILGEQTS